MRMIKPFFKKPIKRKQFNYRKVNKNKNKLERTN